jgi:HlyD family secretion protein
MRKKRLKWIVLIIFVGINCLLVLLDDGEKVLRQAYIPTWDIVYKTDLVETVEAEGIISYSGESYVYFDKSIGSFDSFLIEEGSVVSVGDPLFQYQVNDYAATEALLSYELEKVDGEIDAIEDAITEMVSYRIPKPSTPVVGNNNEDSTTVVVTQQEPVEAELIKEQFIIQKEQELAAKKEQERSIQSQLDDLQENGNTITVESPVDGKVNEISSTLNDPIIRIEHMDLHVQGELEEAARIEVETGQPVEITLDNGEQTLQGSISHLEDAPHEVNIKSQSIYPFEVNFKQDQNLESILPGYHADLAITVNESIDAATVDTSFVNHHHVWKMNEKGKMELVPVQTGIQMGEDLEVISGLSVGNVVTKESIDSSYRGMPFITPLKFKDVAWLDVGRYKDWLLFMTTGIMTR